MDGVQGIAEDDEPHEQASREGGYKAVVFKLSEDPAEQPHEHDIVEEAAQDVGPML